MDVRRPLFAGMILVFAEVATTFAAGWTLFLGPAERYRYLFGAACACLSLAIATWTAGGLAYQALVRRAAEPPEALGRLAGGLTVALASLLGWSLTSGPRVAEASWREIGVVAAAVGCGLSCAALVRWRAGSEVSSSKRSRWPLTVGLAFVSATAVGVDAFVLPRLYPAFHLGAATLALLTALLAASVAPLPHPPRALRYGLAGLAMLVVLASPFALDGLDRAPNAAFVARTHASLSGKLLGLVPARAPAAISLDDAAEVAPPASAGIDLRGRDVLLVTVDALRADRLGAYGGPEGLTPALDALAREGVVFRRAYTPTPHTSYALTSLLTGKYMREVLELPGAPAQHAALPELLREYGYRTAAFYPPAIFFVDASRFAELSRGGFGFEYRKVMFASARQRVAQLERYLQEVAPGYPVFVWVHLFEPHEPYAPPAEFARGDDTVARYEGEVATVDDAVGRLVARFRAARPGGTVIVTADHGEELGDHGGWYHGTTLYDEQVRVPLLWSSPGAVAARVTDVPVELVDLAPTLLSALGIPRDARMRGDDLGGVLRGDDASGPGYAFASVAGRRMVTDGHHKLACEGERCALFDLRGDPRELDDRSARASAVVARLLGVQRRFLASVPRVEAMALADDAGWPDALARAELGDHNAAAELVPLLGDRRAPVRAAAARALGRLSHAPAVPTIARLRRDGDPRVAAEASVAGLLLGDEDAREGAQAALEADTELARRAALALAERGDASGVEVLRGLVADTSAEEEARVAALRSLARLRDRGALEVLEATLPDVRLRPEVVETLAAIGGPRAANAIANAFANERYLAARAAEAKALFSLRDPRAEPLTRRFLGMDRPVPGGVRALVDHRRLALASGAGAELRRAPREGDWRCDEVGCVPGEGASLVLPSARAPRGPARAVWLVDGEGTFVVDGVAHPIEGEVELSIPASAGGRYVLGGSVRVVAVAVVAASDELPPPPPEPWQEGEAPSEDTGGTG